MGKELDKLQEQYDQLLRKRHDDQWAVIEMLKRANLRSLIRAMGEDPVA